MDLIPKLVRRRKRQDYAFQVVGIAATFFGLLALAALLGDLVVDGIGRIDWQFSALFRREMPPKRESFPLGSERWW